MSRVGLAFRCFFKVLFQGRLPADAAAFLPEDAVRAALPAPAAEEVQPKKAPAEKAPAEKAPAEKALADKTAARPSADGGATIERRPAADLAANHRDGALALLSLLQREGRLVDFLRESLEGYSDEDVGVAVRDIHRGCRKVLEEHFVVEAVMPGEEDARVKVPVGFDPGEVRLIGKVAGEPPFTGTLRHHGWRVLEVKLPTLTEGVDRRVLAPAEVEIASA
jgi:hypothetical protein